ncbi:hypothetical protein EON65_21605 [archaeon]|nr:MAG: hypothetical protein EON65_21605 [archaeon]
MGMDSQGMSSPPPVMHHSHGHMPPQHMHMVPMHHMHPNMQSSMHPSMQPNMQPPNMQSNMQPNMQPNIPPNMQTSMQPNMPPSMSSGDNSSMLAVMMDDHDKQPDMHSLLNLHGGDSSDEDH